MDIKSRLYPYPVISDFTDDYSNSSFESAISVVKAGYDIKIQFLSELINDHMNLLIKEDKIKFVYHLECAQTGYRRALQTSDSEVVLVISSKQVCGRLQICPFIVAVEPLNDYVNQDFHDDYKGFKFQIEAGCIMAVGKQVNVDIEKDINDLSNTPSVFSIIKNEDESESNMLIDMNHRKLVIKLPGKDFFNFKSIKDQSIIQPVLNSLIIIPTLTYVLQEISKRDIDDRYEYSTYSWYIAIKKALLNKFNCDIESENFSDENMVVLAQRLINSPLSEAIQLLSTGYGGINEEDDNE